jgi:uncharacterized protein (DUF1330 family)
VCLICVNDKYETQTTGTHFRIDVMRCGYSVARLGQVVTLTFAHYSEYKLQFHASLSKSGCNFNVKGEEIPLQAGKMPEGSRKLRLPYFKDSQHMNEVRLSALRTGHLYPPPSSPQEISLVQISVRG